MYRDLRKSKWLLGMTLCAAMAAPVWAAPGHGAVSERHGRWPQATLQAEATQEVAQDTVRITMATEVTGADQAEVASRVNKALDAALKQAKDNKKVKVSSGNYRVWPMNDKDGRISNWRGRGELLLESKDFEAASALASALGSSLSIAYLNFFVSPQARAEQEAVLLEQAATAFRERAKATALAFDFADYKIKEVQVGGSGAVFYKESAPRMMAMAASDSAAPAAPLEAGTETITVTVQGSIFLLPANK
jgi:predicted secreted protein